jgi:hypothetical protein
MNFNVETNGRPPPGRVRKSRKTLAVLLALLVAAAAGWLVTTGLRWSYLYHPDEVSIAQWMYQVVEEGYIRDRAYPSGWFELFRIRHRLAKSAENLDRNWQRHVTQDGVVTATETASYVPRPDPPSPKPTIQDGRDFNAWLYVLTALFLYAACLEAGFHPVAAFVSALFFLASAVPLEFAHYCETDAGLLVSMAFFAWLSARALRKKSSFLVLAAGFAAGFAVSCKFTLVPLLLWVFAAPAVLCRGTGKTRFRPARFALLAAGGLLAAAAGYLAGTPALRLAPGWYFDMLRHASDRTYAEIDLNLGGRHAWGQATLLRIADLRRGLSAFGALPLLWGVFSWCFWFRKPFRRQLAGLPALLPLFFPFLVCLCPFVRLQELLPCSILFAMGTGLPLACLLSAGTAGAPLRRKGLLAVSAATLFGLAAFASGLIRALGMDSCFSMRDTRAETQNWFHDSLPSKAPVAFDDYVGQIARGVDCVASGFQGLPFCWKGRPEGAPGAATPLYYVENVGFAGRLPIRDARTGRLFPEVGKRMADYEASVFPLKTWSVSRKVSRPTFGQPPVRLVAFDAPAPDAFDVPLGFSGPVRIIADGAQLYDAPGVPGLGACRALRTVGKRGTVHLKLEDAPRWLVTRMLEGGETVRISREGLFFPKKTDLPPGGAVAAALRPGLFERLRSFSGAFSSMKCRMRGDDQTIVCASFLTGSPAEAARELRLGGDPGAALQLLRSAAPLDAEARVEAFLASAALGRPPEAEWAESARTALAACDRLALVQPSMGRTDATLCGVPVGILADFARLRTGWQLFAPGYPLPVYLPPGRYGMRLVFHGHGVPDMPPRLFAVQEGDFAPMRDETGKWTCSTTLDVREGQVLHFLDKKDGVVFEPFWAEPEISWSPVDFTLAAAETLRAALDGNHPPRN